MKLDGIETFVAVVETESFSKAAQRLQMPPATVSAQIARLERRLGITLIQRTTRRLHVTSAGRDYYRHCATAIAEMAEAQQQLSSSAQPAGKLRITAPPDLATLILPSLVERFLDTYDKASVEIISTNRDVDLLSEGIDLALRPGHLADSTLTIRSLCTVDMCLFASAAYLRKRGTPQSPADLKGHTMVALEAGNGFKMTAGRRSFALSLTGRLIAHDFDTVRNYLARGNGIGLLPDFAGASLVRVLPDYAGEKCSVVLAYPAQKFVPALLRAFIETAISTKMNYGRRYP